MPEFGQCGIFKEISSVDDEKNGRDAKIQRKYLTIKNGEPEMRPLMKMDHRPNDFFNQLPIEMFYFLLDYMPLIDIARLGQTSRTLRDLVLEWVKTTHFIHRITAKLVTKKWKLTDAIYETHLYLPDELQVLSLQVGLLLKKITCVIPSQKRIYVYQQVTCQMKQIITKKCPCFDEVTLLSVMGSILQVLVAGWDENECCRVYTTLTNWLHLSQSLEGFLSNPIATNKIAEASLRLYLKALFFDFCSENDRSMWTDIIFNRCNPLQSPTDTQQAKLVLLLNAPLRQLGQIRWDFYEEVEDIDSYTEEYKAMAQSLERLHHLELRANSCSKNLSLDILAAVVSCPSMWPNRSAAALLLFLHSSDSTLVIKYFKLLRKALLREKAADILTEAVYITMVLSRFGSSVSGKTIANLLRNALGSGWSSSERKQIVTNMWRNLRDLTDLLLDEAVLADDSSDLLSFLEVWKEICIQMFI